MQLFYAPDIQTELRLPEDEARHCFKVLRKKVGDQIDVVDGKGGLHSCTIIMDHPKKNQLRIDHTETDFRKRNKHLHLAIAPTKNLDRMEWLVEKATEIGVEEITFLLCKHSERKVVKVDRLMKKAISAMKQSGKAIVPTINEMVLFKNFVTTVSETNKYIAHLRDDSQDLRAFQEQDNICVLIGPEGDFSSEEIEWALQNNFQSVTLGKSRLRTETAGIITCSWLAE